MPPQFELHCLAKKVFDLSWNGPYTPDNSLANKRIYLNPKEIDNKPVVFLIGPVAKPAYLREKSRIQRNTHVPTITAYSGRELDWNNHDHRRIMLGNGLIKLLLADAAMVVGEKARCGLYSRMEIELCQLCHIPIWDFGDTPNNPPPSESERIRIAQDLMTSDSPMSTIFTQTIDVNQNDTFLDTTSLHQCIIDYYQTIKEDNPHRRWIDKRLNQFQLSLLRNHC